MGDLIRVLILGTGQMGAGIARLVLEKPGLELAGAYARRAERAGMDIGQAIGVGKDLGIAIEADLTTAVQRTRPHIAIQATCSKLEDAWPEISMVLRHGVPIVSIAEEMAYPACSSPAIAQEMHNLAQAQGVVALGTGINPGFVLDLLVIAMTGVCARIDFITATRVNDLSPYGPSVLQAQGVGLEPEAFAPGVKSGTVAGHFGFPQSIRMIGTALGLNIGRIEEERRPIVSQVHRETAFVSVAPGQVAGCAHTATAYDGDKPIITLVHPQQIRPELEGVETGDTIEISGTPSLRLEARPEIPGGQGTIAIAVNMIPRVLNAAPGLHTMADLPVPSAMMGDARQFLYARGEERHHG
jgi:4-hydroxy-tetrahydrodipicolinate reductase